jgi:hypothetical protein
VNGLVIHDKELWCWPCHNEVKYAHIKGTSAYVIQDSIEGGVEIKHGICNPDGTPKKYYSKKEIRDAAYEAGYFQGNDTPRSNPKIVEQRAREKEARRSH